MGFIYIRFTPFFNKTSCRSRFTLKKVKAAKYPTLKDSGIPLQNMTPFLTKYPLTIIDDSIDICTSYYVLFLNHTIESQRTLAFIRIIFILVGQSPIPHRRLLNPDLITIWSQSAKIHTPRLLSKKLEPSFPAELIFPYRSRLLRITSARTCFPYTDEIPNIRHHLGFIKSTLKRISNFACLLSTSNILPIIKMAPALMPLILTRYLITVQLS